MATGAHLLLLTFLLVQGRYPRTAGAPAAGQAGIHLQRRGEFAPSTGASVVPIIRFGNRTRRMDYYAARDTARINQLLGELIPSSTIRALDRHGDMDQFLAVVSLGTPPKPQKLIIDTGSAMSWVLCWCGEDCARDPAERARMYTPADSTSAEATRCGTWACLEAGGDCVGSTRSLTYADGSTSNGMVVQDRLSLTSSGSSIDDFIFGCTVNTPILMGRADGLLGLGRGALSVMEQMLPGGRPTGPADARFAYCKMGYLTMGWEPEPNSAIQFTRMFWQGDRPFYHVQLAAMAVGGTRIPLLSQRRTIVDSGTALTYVPSEVHAAVTDVYLRMFGQYHLVYYGASCFNLTDVPEGIYVPEVCFHFYDGARLRVASEGIFFRPDLDERIECLPYAAHSDGNDFSIIGWLQQQSIEIVFDTAGDRLGFGPIGSC